MITCSLRGQLGNQAFQVATTIAHALRNNTDYAFPERSGKRDQFPFMFSHLPLINKIRSSSTYREQEFGIYHEIPSSNHLHLFGYFQSEKYFKDYRREIIEALNFPKYEMKYDTVAVHVRRGDYLRLAQKHNVSSIEYLIQAINQFDERYRFIFFSDDIQWCMDNFKGSKYSFALSKDPLYAIGLIAACEHGIISSSTFGWWGNWIADNNEKGRRVIAPKNWFVPEYTRLRSDDIVPKYWERI